MKLQLPEKLRKAILAVMLGAPIAQADVNQTFVFGVTEDNPWAFGSYQKHTDGQGTDFTGSTENGMTATLDISTGKLWKKDFKDEAWNNSAALTEYNTASGNSLTAEQLLAPTFSSSNAGGAYTTLVLELDPAMYAAGDSVVMYALVAGYETQPITSLTITGLTGAEYWVAKGTGNGFTDPTAVTNWADLQYMNIVKITGTLTATDGGLADITLKGNSTKSGFAAVTTIVESPATDFYWESGSDNSWAGANWSETEGDTSGLAALPTTGTVNVYFNKSETASVSIGNGAQVTSMAVNAGTYTFTGNKDAKLTVTGAFAVADGATANIQTGIRAGSISTAGSLSLTGDIVTNSITVNAGGELNLSNTTIDSDWVVSNQGTINLGGTINLVGFSATTGADTAPVSGNGFGSITTSYVIWSSGSSAAAADTVWHINGAAVQGDTSFDNGTLDITTATTTYYVSGSNVTYDGGASFAGAASLVLNGGNLCLEAVPTEADFITATAKGGSIDLNGNELSQKSLANLAGTVELNSGAAPGSVYHLGADLALLSGVSLADTWAGTVKMNDVDNSALALDISSLGNAGSHIQLGHMNLQSLTDNGAASVTADSLSLARPSYVGGNLTVAHALVLGNDAGAAHLTVDGSMSTDRIVLGNAESHLTAKSLHTSGANITIAVANQSVLNQLNAAVGDHAVTLISLSEAYTGADVVFDTTTAVSRLLSAAQVDKYFSLLEWDAEKKNLLYHSRVNENYVSEVIRAHTHNGRAGESMLQQVFLEQNPQVSDPAGDLAMVMDAVDSGLMTDANAAAVAGSSTATLGMALAGDVERQLRAIRNRTTTMGVNQCVVNEDMPYINAWVNAEGNLAELDQDGTFAGYSLESWGGTVGFDVDVNPALTLGLAVTAMYGNLTVDGPDMMEGDMDTMYLSAFARYSKRAWTHTFIGTVGTMDASYERTVNLVTGRYTTKGDTDGTAFGLMYELGRVFALDEEGDACWQPVLNVAYRHASVGGYTEDASDAALKVDDQTLDTVTFGAGARLQAVVGENLYNRTSVLELRALAKLDAGDRSSEADVAFIGGGHKATVESAELGAFGVELGAGLSVPLGDENSGTLFFDVSAELRSGYSNVNGTVGYRINF